MLHSLFENYKFKIKKNEACNILLFSSKSFLCVGEITSSEMDQCNAVQVESFLSIGLNQGFP